jgi:hypothetical protein
MNLKDHPTVRRLRVSAPNKIAQTGTSTQVTFLDEERRELGPMRYSEEYELAFLEPDEAVFMTALIDRAFTTEVRPLWQ